MGIPKQVEMIFVKVGEGSRSVIAIYSSTPGQISETRFYDRVTLEQMYIFPHTHEQDDSGWQNSLESFSREMQADGWSLRYNGPARNRLIY